MVLINEVTKDEINTALLALQNSQASGINSSTTPSQTVVIQGGSSRGSITSVTTGSNIDTSKIEKTIAENKEATDKEIKLLKETDTSQNKKLSLLELANERLEESIDDVSSSVDELNNYINSGELLNKVEEVSRNTAQTEIQPVAEDVEDLKSRLETDETAISENATNIQTNATNIQNNTSDIQTSATNIQNNTNDINDIKSLIPSTASSTNKLTDEDFVNSSIATNTANFIGTFNSVAELNAYSGTKTNNDYAFVVGTDSAGNTTYTRYKWTGTQWLEEYVLNNSSFTAEQWASINSGITSDIVSSLSNLGNAFVYIGARSWTNYQLVNFSTPGYQVNWTKDTGVTAKNGQIGYLVVSVGTTRYILLGYISNATVSATEIQMQTIGLIGKDKNQYLTNTTDANTLIIQGSYFGIFSNTPKPYGTLFVMQYTSVSNNNYSSQLFIPAGDYTDGTQNKMYFRTSNNGTWNSWIDLTQPSVFKTFATRPTSANIVPLAIPNADSEYGTKKFMLATSSMTTGKPSGDGFIDTYFWDTSGRYDAQLFLPDNSSNHLQYRTRNNGTTWLSWKNIAYMEDILRTSVIESSTQNISYVKISLKGDTGQGFIFTRGNESIYLAFGKSDGSYLTPSLKLFSNSYTKILGISYSNGVLYIKLNAWANRIGYTAITGNNLTVVNSTSTEYATGTEIAIKDIDIGYRIPLAQESTTNGAIWLSSDSGQGISYPTKGSGTMSAGGLKSVVTYNYRIEADGFLQMWVKITYGQTFASANTFNVDFGFPDGIVMKDTDYCVQMTFGTTGTRHGGPELCVTKSTTHIWTLAYNRNATTNITSPYADVYVCGYVE